MNTMTFLYVIGGLVVGWVVRHKGIGVNAADKALPTVKKVVDDVKSEVKVDASFTLAQLAAAAKAHQDAKAKMAADEAAVKQVFGA